MVAKKQEKEPEESNQSAQYLSGYRSGRIDGIGMIFTKMISIIDEKGNGSDLVAMWEAIIAAMWHDHRERGFVELRSRVADAPIDEVFRLQLLGCMKAYEEKVTP